MPLYKTDAIILRSRELSEADRIFILLSPMKGRIDCIAKGVRRPNSKFGGSLEVFSHVYLLLAEGKNFDIINQVEVCNPYYSLREDLPRLACASYFLELVEASILPGQELIDLFALVLSGLSLLEHHNNTELVLRYVELHFLDILGVGPVLDICQMCGKKLSSSICVFHFSSGGAFCKECKPAGLTGYFIVSIKTLQFLSYLRRFEPDGIKEFSLSRKIYEESKYLLRSLLLSHLSKDIKSVKFLDSITG